MPRRNSESEIKEKIQKRKNSKKFSIFTARWIRMFSCQSRRIITEANVLFCQKSQNDVKVFFFLLVQIRFFKMELITIAGTVMLFYTLLYFIDKNLKVNFYFLTYSILVNYILTLSHFTGKKFNQVCKLSAEIPSSD